MNRDIQKKALTSQTCS